MHHMQVVKVLHGADSDIVWLQRDFGIYVTNLFDTGQAARVLGIPLRRPGLPALQILQGQGDGSVANPPYVVRQMRCISQTGGLSFASGYLASHSEGSLPIPVPEDVRLEQQA